MPDGSISYIAKYRFDDLSTGWTCFLSNLFGPLGVITLEAAFRNSARHLPDGIAKFFRGWQAYPPFFIRIAYPVNCAAACHISMKLNFQDKTLYMKSEPYDPTGENASRLQELARTEIARLRSMATAQEYSRRDFEGAARWISAKAGLDENGDWLEEYEMETLDWESE